MGITIKNVADKAGVSAATVSRVVGNYGYVSEKNRRKVQAAIRELGYQPNAVARSMVTKSTHIIGLVLTDILNPFFAHLARGVEKITWENHYNLILANTDEDVEREASVIQTLQTQQVDGLIVVPASSRPSPHLAELAKRKIPLVLIDRSVQDLAVDVVMVDNEHGAFQAVLHLIQMGHHKIGMIMDNPGISTNVERMAGYQRALASANIPYDPASIQSCQYTEQSARELVTAMLTGANPPTAIFTANNFMTLGALSAIHQLGLKMPEQIALVGFDDLDIVQFGNVQLYSVVQPVHEMGAVAAERLLARLKGDQSPPMEIRLKTRFTANPPDRSDRP